MSLHIDTFNVLPGHICQRHKKAAHKHCIPVIVNVVYNLIVPK